jgi:hypothetical protein
MRFSPAETASRSPRAIGLLDAELGACPRFSPDAAARVNVGVIDGELERVPVRGSVAPRAPAPKRKLERASEPVLAADGIARGR